MTPLHVAAPVVLPASWRELQNQLQIDVRVYENAFGLRVLVGVENRGPGVGWWVHVSMSRASKLPSWADVREVKDLFIGRDRCAVHLLPPEAFYINLHPFTFHLWSRLDAPTVPPRLYEDQ